MHRLKYKNRSLLGEHVTHTMDREDHDTQSARPSKCPRCNHDTHAATFWNGMAQDIMISDGTLPQAQGVR